MRAALISFVAAAVARDGFEIGVIRSRSEQGTITVFPDGKSIYPFLTSAWANNLMQTFFSFGVAYGVGFPLGMVLTNPIYQTLMAGLVGGGMATFVGMQNRVWNSSLISCIRFFIWPGFTMAATYFLILAYLSRILLQTRISPSADLALLIGISCAWLTIEIRFLNTLPPLYKAAIPSSYESVPCCIESGAKRPFLFLTSPPFSFAVNGGIDACISVTSILILSTV
jgi:hypothetical protein